MCENASNTTQYIRKIIVISDETNSHTKYLALISTGSEPTAAGILLQSGHKCLSIIKCLTPGTRNCIVYIPIPNLCH